MPVNKAGGRAASALGCDGDAGRQSGGAMEKVVWWRAPSTLASHNYRQIIAKGHLVRLQSLYTERLGLGAPQPSDLGGVWM